MLLLCYFYNFKIFKIIIAVRGAGGDGEPRGGLVPRVSRQAAPDRRQGGVEIVSCCYFC